MPKVSRNASRYKFTKQEAKVFLNEQGVDHIIKLSAVDLIKSMPIEDIKKIFHVQQKEPVHVEGDVYEYEIVVSIPIKD